MEQIYFTSEAEALDALNLDWDEVPNGDCDAKYSLADFVGRAEGYGYEITTTGRVIDGSHEVLVIAPADARGLRETWTERTLLDALRRIEALRDDADAFCDSL